MKDFRVRVVWQGYNLCNRLIFLFHFSLFIIKLTSTTHMKRIFKKVFKSKEPSLGSIHGPGSPTPTSTLTTSTIDLIPSIPARYSDAAPSAQVTAGVSVSVQLCPSHLKVLTYCFRAERS